MVLKVKLLVGRAGPAIGVENAGDVIDVDKDEAERLISTQQAEPVKSSSKRTAKASAAETPEG